MLRLVLVFLITYLASVILAKCPEMEGIPSVYIDGYSANKSYECQANLSLGTTLVLACRVGRLNPHEFSRVNYTWTYSKQGYVKKIKKNVLAISITSELDSGRYTCNAFVGEHNGSRSFVLNVTGGEVVHSYGRLILNEEVIFDKRQLQPPNRAKGNGMIECSVRSGGAKLEYYGIEESNTLTDSEVKQTIDPSGFNTTMVIERTALRRNKKFAIEGKCGSLFHYLFLKKDAYCRNLDQYVNITPSNSSITVTIDKLPCGIARAIVGYARLVEGVWVELEYVNLPECGSKIFSTLGHGTDHRITAWGLSGGDTDIRRRCKSPTVRTMSYNFMSSRGASSPRDLFFIGVGSKVQMYWILPMESNGDISHYKIKLMQNGMEREVNTTSNINYHTLTGMVKGESYNITVMAVHEDGSEGERVMKTYFHYPSANK